MDYGAWKLAPALSILIFVTQKPYKIFLKILRPIEVAGTINPPHPECPISVAKATLHQLMSVCPS